MDLLIAELKKQFGIALTGGVACGKSTVAEMIRKSGYTVIDADQLARQVVSPASPVLNEVVKIFGPQILASDGTLDRQKLRAVIFADPKMRRMLEAIMHPAIQIALEEELRRCGLTQKPRTWFYEIPLLFEVGAENEFKEVWVVACSEATQIARLTVRNKITTDEALRMIHSQWPIAEKVKHGTHVIDTDVEFLQVEEQVQKCLSGLGL